MMNDLSFDYIQIIAGTDNMTSPAYVEAAKNVENNTDKGMEYMQNFIISIERVGSKASVQDERITKTRGNVRNFVAYDSIKQAIEFLQTHTKGSKSVNVCATLLKSLEELQPQYSEAYDKNCRLGILEYENGVYILTGCLCMILASDLDIVCDTLGNIKVINVPNKSDANVHMIEKLGAKYAKEISSPKHKTYLNEILKNVQSDVKAIGEASISQVKTNVDDTMNLISSVWSTVKRVGQGAWHMVKTVKDSLFGIIPLIRSVIYLRFKKKADTVVSLEQQVAFIQDNIEQLKNNKTMDPEKKKEIIKKQEAYISAYQKKAAKLRAQLGETEKEASEAMEKENPDIGSKDGGFVLEYVDDDDDYDDDSSFVDSLTEAAKSDRFSQLKASGPSTNASTGTIRIEGKKEQIAALNRVLDEVDKETAKKTIRLVPGKVHKTERPSDIAKTKFGGIPYWTDQKTYPKTSDKEPKMMLAQLNLGELPEIDGFPTSGIIQVFVDPRHFEDDKRAVEVVYHPNIVSGQGYTIPSKYTTYNSNIGRTRNLEMPFSEPGCYFPRAHIQTSHLEPYRAEFAKIVMPKLNAEFGTKWKALTDMTADLWHALWEHYKKLDGRNDPIIGCRMGGHYWCTVDDHPVDLTKNVLLLQLYHEAGLMFLEEDSWFDIFVKAESLANLKNAHTTSKITSVKVVTDLDR